MRSMERARGSSGSPAGANLHSVSTESGLNDSLPRSKSSPSPLDLLRTVETSVIPRLMMAYKEQRPELPRTSSKDFTAAEIRHFACLCTSDDVSPMLEVIDTALRSGYTLEDVYLKLFAPSARELGTLWAEDRLSFMQVTLGGCRLHHALCEYAARESTSDGQVGRSVLLLPAPGDQHTLGVVIVAEFFRRAGWSVDSALNASEQEVIDDLGASHFDVLGISMSADSHVSRVRNLVSRARQASRNPKLQIMIGGAAVLAKRDLLLQVGADALATDGADAVRQADLALARASIQGIYVN